MQIVGCDLHVRQQTVAMLDTETGELVEKTLYHEELKRFYRRKLVQKGLGKAKVAAARKLGIRLYIMLRDQIDYKEFCRRGQLQRRGGARAGMPGQS